jgi:protein-export membrane protein SecD
MLHYARWKQLAILGSVVLGILLGLPNVVSKETQDWLRTYTIARPMTLGLDLRGGSNILLEVDRVDMVTKQLLPTQASDIRSALRDARIGYRLTPGADSISVRILQAADIEKAEPILQNLLRPIDRGGLNVGATANLFELTRNNDVFTYRVSETGLEANISRAIDQSMRIIGNRVNALGTTEPVIQRQGIDRISVQLPGIQNPDEVKRVIGTTAKLTFQMVCDAQPTAESTVPPADCAAFPQKENPEQPLWVQTASSAMVDGADLVDAQPAFGQNNDPIVSFRFNQKGAVRFGKLTAENVGRPFAIILDGVVQSAPVIQTPILGGSGQISGRFTTEETNSLAVVLRSGALPAKLTIAQETTVGPSLGSDSIRAGVIAAIIGLIGVMIFMVLVYGIFGIFANLALLVNLILLIAIMSVFGFTLTLPGIAGIVLTMGMAVDSNVLVYERIREEWRNGRSALSAIETGFKQALATVIDANVTTLIAAVVLFGVGSGPIRGFAVTLAIGVFTTMYTAFTVTRLIVSLWVKQTRPKEVPL